MYLSGWNQVTLWSECSNHCGGSYYASGPALIVLLYLARLTDTVGGPVGEGSAQDSLFSEGGKVFQAQGPACLWARVLLMTLKYSVLALSYWVALGPNTWSHVNSECLEYSHERSILSSFLPHQT